MIRVTRQERLWIATIDRADKANALTRDMLEHLLAVADDAARNANVLILTGAGRVFSAGADLDAARQGLATDPIWEQLSSRIARAPCLTIAALNGTLAGGAFGMALACDLRLCVPAAKFFYPVMKLGFLPQPSDPARLAALIGPARARMILMAGQTIDAEEAQAWGLIDRIVAPAELLDAARALGDDARQAKPAHLAAIKAMFA